VASVCLYGPLADTYGARHEFDIRNAREAVRALAANFDGFMKDFLATGEYYLVVDGTELSGDDAPLMPVTAEVHLVPKIEGSGLEIIGSAIASSIAGWLGVSAITAKIITGVLMTAVMLGVSMLLAPRPPKMGGRDERKDDSYLFSGPANLTAQGAVIPVAYGTVHVGSVVISAGIETGEEPIDPPAGGGEGGGKSK